MPSHKLRDSAAAGGGSERDRTRARHAAGAGQPGARAASAPSTHPVPRREHTLSGPAGPALRRPPRPPAPDRAPDPAGSATPHHGTPAAPPAAARSASRVLPTPPIPVSVTSRESASSRLTSASSPRPADEAG